MSNADLIELFDEAIGNAKCIGRLDGMWQGRGPWPEQDYRGMVALEQANSSKRKKLSDALAAADKRIAELEADYSAMSHLAASYLGSKRKAERKLAVAREALNYVNWMIGFSSAEAAAEWNSKVEKALAQIGGEDARS